jgi:20S proteasome alpha/beta subunit
MHRISPSLSIYLSINLASYGSLARFMHLERLKKIGDQILIGAGGEYGDFQEISDMLEELMYVVAPPQSCCYCCCCDCVD